MMDCPVSYERGSRRFPAAERKAAPAWMGKPGKGARRDAEEQQPSEPNLRFSNTLFHLVLEGRGALYPHR